MAVALNRIRLLEKKSKKLHTQLEWQNNRIAYSQAISVLYQHIQPKLPLIWTNDYMIGPDVLLLCLDHILGKENLVVLECGSGISSVVIGYALQKNGSGRLVSVEHSEQYARQSRANIQRHGLEDIVEVVHAPLESYSLDGGEWQWYSTQALQQHITAGINVLLVDGPPGTLQRESRFPAMPLLRQHLSDDAIVIVDDYKRDEEKKVVERWNGLYGEIAVENYYHCLKGAALLRLGPQENS